VKIAAIYFFAFIDGGMLDRVAFPSGPDAVESVRNCHAIYESVSPKGTCLFTRLKGQRRSRTA
jgi:hypothetical protein